MASRRTISYIGLWALIMPWLGFSWGTKTILFSLTGILLLVIGNRHYNSEKKKSTTTKPAVVTPPIAKEEPVLKPISTYEPVPEYMSASSTVTMKTHIDHEEPKTEFVFEPKEEPEVVYNTIISNVETGDNPNFEKPKPRKRIKIEMPARPKRTSPKPITLDSLNSDYGEEQI